MNNKIYLKNGKYVEYGDNGYYRTLWYLNGKLHKENGAALELFTGWKEWHYYGKRAIDKEQFYDNKWRAEILLDLV